MKRLNYFYIACIYYVTIPLSAVSQDIGKSIINYDKFGNVNSVKFSSSNMDNEKIKSADVFFKDFLKVKENITFVRNQKIKLEKGHETFEQFYKGIRVDNAGYTFHYDENGCIKYAHGNYVDISNIDIEPIISEEDALKAFAIFKGLSPDHITQSSSELIIKRIKRNEYTEVPLLVYKVSIAVNNICVTDYGYIDANTGDVVSSESYIDHSVSTGTFVTKYYGTKYATTNFTDYSYSLYDPTRGNGIEVKDLQNYCMDYTDYINYAVPISDGDNYWHYSNYSDSTFMAYDVYCAFHQIYDRLYNVHNKSSLDNDGKKIMAYVKASFLGDNNLYTENACWSNCRQEFYFGIGSGWNRPVSALDVVAHEYGHGITKYQIGWTSNESYLNEGLSDIWAAIMDYRFGDSNSAVWKIGEHLIPSKACLRDIETPESNSANSKMANTYNSALYNQFVIDNDYYGMSGVFSHWFYLLVNGGQGYNSNGAYYNLTPIGMDVAENLIVKAVYDNYLRDKTSYLNVREAFIIAAEDMNVNGLATAVKDAWYAVDVHPSLIVSGPSLVCGTGTYTIDIPSYATILWSTSNSNLSIVSGQGTDTVTFQKNSNGACVITAQVTIGTTTQNLTKNVWAGTPTAPSISGWPHTNMFLANSQYQLFASTSSLAQASEYQWDVVRGATITSGANTNGPTFTINSSGTVRIGVRARNACGWGPYTYMNGGITNDNGQTPINSPGNNIVNIPLPEEGEYEIMLWNTNRLIRTVKTSQSSYDVDLNGLPSDLYIIKVMKDGQSIYQLKVKK